MLLVKLPRLASRFNLGEEGEEGNQGDFYVFDFEELGEWYSVHTWEG